MQTEFKSPSNPDPLGQSASGCRHVDDEADSDLAGLSPRPAVGLHVVRGLCRDATASARPSGLGSLGGRTETNQDRLSKEAHPLGASQEGHGCPALEEGHHEKPEKGYGRPAAQEIHPEGKKQQ